MLLTTSFFGGWQLRAIQAQRDVLQIQSDHANQRVAAQHRARQREYRLRQDMEAIQHETQQQLDQIRTAERAASDSRVRELAQTYAAARATGAHSPAADGRQTERTRAAVLAELLAELDQLAAGFALQADRNRISGLACGKAHAALRKIP